MIARQISALVLLVLTFHWAPTQARGISALDLADAEMARSGFRQSVAAGAPSAQDGPSDAFAATVGNPLADLPGALATLLPQLTIAANSSGNAVVNALPTLPGGVLVTVYQIGAPVLSQLRNVAGLNLNGADMVVINVFGSASAVQNLNLFAGASNMIWNVVEETTITLRTTVGSEVARNVMPAGGFDTLVETMVTAALVPADPVRRSSQTGS